MYKKLLLSLFTLILCLNIPNIGFAEENMQDNISAENIIVQDDTNNAIVAKFFDSLVTVYNGTFKGLAEDNTREARDHFLLNQHIGSSLQFKTAYYLNKLRSSYGYLYPLRKDKFESFLSDRVYKLQSKQIFADPKNPTPEEYEVFYKQLAIIFCKLGKRHINIGEIELGEKLQSSVSCLPGSKPNWCNELK